MVQSKAYGVLSTLACIQTVRANISRASAGEIFIVVALRVGRSGEVVDPTQSALLVTQRYFRAISEVSLEICVFTIRTLLPWKTVLRRAQKAVSCHGTGNARTQDKRAEIYSLLVTKR